MFLTFNQFFVKEKDVPPNETENIELNDMIDIKKVIKYFWLE